VFNDSCKLLSLDKLCGYEIIGKGKPCAVYFDLDWLADVDDSIAHVRINKVVDVSPNSRLPAVRVQRAVCTRAAITSW
jgi:hypothetical protein